MSSALLFCRDEFGRAANECELTPSCTQCQQELDMLLYITSRVRPDTLLADVGCCNVTGRVFFRMVTFLCERGVHFALLPIPLRSMIEFAKGRQCEVCISSSHIPRLDVLASGSSEFRVQACKVSVRRDNSILSRHGRKLAEECSKFTMNKLNQRRANEKSIGINLLYKVSHEYLLERKMTNVTDIP